MAKKWIGYIGVGSLMCAALGCGILYTRQARLQQTISDKVLRFHVLANSDSEADQNLKLAVRDAVGSFMQEKLAAVENLEECELVVRQSLGEIEEAAAETIAENGYDYDVTAELEHTSFPVKNYGSYTFPAGDYEALRIVIGEGNGHNWWCVMYPNMCFSDSMYEVVDKEAGEKLREVLTIAENGYDYDVTAELEHTSFPVKNYGSYTFPAGDYEALRIVIGEGNGHNWWCVMYPNMCFSDSMYEVVDKEAGEKLREVLTTEEYEKVLAEGDYQVRMKYFSWLNPYLEKLAEN